MEVDEETKKLDMLLLDFGLEMKKKLLQKKREGFSGWDNPANEEMILRQFVIKSGYVISNYEDEVDCANLLMFLWNFRRRK